jgi:hypothetical protein
MKDTFRKEYKPLHEKNSALVVFIKEKAEELEALLLKVQSREMSLAMTNLEQCTMWATKAVVLTDENNGSKPIDEGV